MNEHASVGLGSYVADARTRRELVVQPRMGFSAPDRMRAGLDAVRAVPGCTVGTITLDSYTRVGDDAAVSRALDLGVELNGYPIVHHPPETTASVLGGAGNAGHPVQVRHGSAVPERIIDRLVQLRISATEGGPVSYCLPYGRSPLAASVQAWARSCRVFSRLREHGAEPHLETFGGCLLGQLCPPGLLVAMSVLEAVFFAQNGIRCVSLSYAQQANAGQDREAVAALRALAARFLPGVRWHVVFYTYMGVYPLSRLGAQALQDEAVRLAVRSGCERLIVKTTAESSRIPDVGENVDALRRAAALASALPRVEPDEPAPEGAVFAEARALVEATLSLHADVGTALLLAFRRGYLDVPYCLHPDNAGRSRGWIAEDGSLHWTSTGNMPVPEPVREAGHGQCAADLLRALHHVRRRFDAPSAVAGASTTGDSR
ncbi:methylaspartate mutase [Amycolatopsis sp. NPDC088138]|uniref:methylaspartate mutase n=1 Tax=Amycolatopsis sp. NPDC088138 TaxID=3363938 RepID=UPI0037F3ECCA